MKKCVIDIESVDVVVFDFDGVLTDNRVYVNERGEEMVACNRADGLAFDVLNRTHLKSFILSTETNPVVARRAAKLGVPVYQGCKNKQVALVALAQAQNFALTRTLFVGNDLNDLAAMRVCGYAACPADGHPRVRRYAQLRLRTAGGCGVARELVERIFRIDVKRMLQEAGQ